MSPEFEIVTKADYNKVKAECDCDKVGRCIGSMIGILNIWEPNDSELISITINMCIESMSIIYFKLDDKSRENFLDKVLGILCTEVKAKSIERAAILEASMTEKVKSVGKAAKAASRKKPADPVA